jgi:5-methylcytosine-specific restriction protein A
MANRPLRPCRHPGCPNLVTAGYCDRHKKDERQYDRYRKNIRERGYTSMWDKVSRRHKELHPLCEECLKNNMITVTAISHHIIPEQLCMQVGRKDLIYDMDNLKADCISHHGEETTIDKLWYEFAKHDNMQGTAKEIHARFDKWKSRYGRGV